MSPQFAARLRHLPVWLIAISGLTSGLMDTARAAPLRLSMDTVALGPAAEPVEVATLPAQPATPAAEASVDDDDLSFATAPDLQFPDLHAPAAARAADDDWLQAARALHDEPAAMPDRRLGAFAPAVPPALAARADPIDEVSLAPVRPSRSAALGDAGRQPAPSDLANAPPSTPLWLALGGLVACGLAVALGLAAWRVWPRHLERRRASTRSAA